MHLQNVATIAPEPQFLDRTAERLQIQKCGRGDRLPNSLRARQTAHKNVGKGTQYNRNVTSIGTIVATGLPLGPTAGLNFQPFTASIAFSSSPRPGPFTTEIFTARPSVVIVT